MSEILPFIVAGLLIYFLICVVYTMLQLGKVYHKTKWYNRMLDNIFIGPLIGLAYLIDWIRR